MLITDVQLKKGILDMYSTKLKRYTLPTGRKVVEPNPELKQFLKKLNNKAVALYEQLLNKHNLQNIPQAYRKKPFCQNKCSNS